MHPVPLLALSSEASGDNGSGEMGKSWLKGLALKDSHRKAGVAGAEADPVQEHEACRGRF